MAVLRRSERLGVARLGGGNSRREPMTRAPGLRTRSVTARRRLREQPGNGCPLLSTRPRERGGWPIGFANTEDHSGRRSMRGAIRVMIGVLVAVQAHAALSAVAAQGKAFNACSILTPAE